MFLQELIERIVDKMYFFTDKAVIYFLAYAQIL